MKNNRDKIVVSLASYQDRTGEFFAGDPRMSSRIAHYIDSAPYGPDELMAIGRGMLDRAACRLCGQVGPGISRPGPGG